MVNILAAAQEAVKSVATAAKTSAPVINQVLIFWIALALMVLFIAYFAVEKANLRRWVGTILALGVTAFTYFFYKHFPMPQGIDLRGGVEFVLEIQKEGEKEIDNVARNQVIATLQRRLDAGGVTDLTMSPQGTNRILLQMPGITEDERKVIRKTLETTAHLEIRLAHPETSPALINRISEGDAFFAGYEVLPPYDEKTGQSAVVEILKVVDGTAVQNAFRSYGPNGFQINVKLDGKGGDRMFDVTGKHIGEPMAIIVDDKVVSVANIRDRFGSDFVITGTFTQQEAENLATFLKNPLAKPINIVSESGVSAAMGQETIRQGVAAGLGGLLVTLIFMLFYYRIAGFIAVAGLAVNVVIIFGIMSMFQFVMTMPGIAGIILTIGMSIDANVLIYERFREEQHAGKSLRAALDASYEKAFSAIFDSNITTLIAAFVLLWMATGTIKGFSTTLIIGVIGCLFAALLVTKVLFSWLLESNLLKNIKMWGVVREPNFDFMKYRFHAIAVSLTVMAICIGVFFVKKDAALGVDLKGGDLVTIRSEASLTVAKLEESLAKAKLSTTPLVQQQKALAQNAVFYTIRTADNEGDTALTHLRKDLGQALPDTSLESIGSQVGQEMLTKSIWALALSMVGIFIYLAIRFESMAFSLGAIVALIHDVVAAAGLLVVFGHEVTLIVVGAVLTIAGYSVNDTIVIFDRIRDNLKTMRGEVKDIMNVALNATLSRTIITSALTLQVVVVLYLFGGPSLKDFSLTLIIGMISGVISTVFVACPVVLWWAKFHKLNLRRQILDAEAAKAASNAAPTKS